MIARITAKKGRWGNGGRNFAVRLLGFINGRRGVGVAERQLCLPTMIDT
jgi:hypothetical protein